jgi:dihydrofolate reductase
MMSTLVVLEYVSLDGVIQAPGFAGEDSAGGFEHGGWTGPFMGDHRRAVTGSFRAADAFVFGRLTYDIFAAVWPGMTSPDDEIASALNGRPKYVASTSLVDPAWAGTTVLGPDPVADVAALRAEPGREILVVGSGEVARLLMAADLVDEIRLLVHPIVVGSGKKLFADRPEQRPMDLVEATVSTGGLVMLAYRPIRAAQGLA